MIVLTTSTSAQTFSFIPRDGFNTMILTDDQTNTPVTVAITSSTQGDYINTITASFALKEGHFYDLVLKQGTDIVTITASFALKEGHFYDLVLKQGTDIVYKDRIFCTDQNIVNFSVNSGEYTSNTTANTYIVYE